MKASFGTLCLLVAAAAITVPGPGAPLAGAGDPPPMSAETAKLSPIERGRQFLADRLGIPVEKLTDETDLVRDLKLDRGEVTLVVTDFLKINGTAEPTRQQMELTQVKAILQSASALTRTFRGKTLTGADFFIQPVYWATDRKATAGSPPPEEAYGVDRAQGGLVTYGRAEINIPKSHAPGKIERPWLDSVTWLDPKLHIFVKKLDKLDEKTFFEAAGGGGTDDILVYIHGFNVSFADALLRAGQIAFDFDFPGTTFAFTWPSYRSVTAYTSDWENAIWASKHVEVFLEKLATTAKASNRKVHIVAHSMGNKALLYALRNLAYRGVKGPLFGSVMLCAPDFDAGAFREQVAQEIRPLSDQWVVYTSENDFALTTSQSLTTLRLGKPVTPAEGFEIIDASIVEVTPWSLPEAHSYYAVKKPVIDDMRSVLKGLKAEARGLQVKPNPHGLVWTFPKLAAE
jgi:esterase/lipase superfamily enzyme